MTEKVYIETEESLEKIQAIFQPDKVSQCEEGLLRVLVADSYCGEDYVTNKLNEAGIEGFVFTI